jgi:hypothetical protein
MQPLALGAAALLGASRKWDRKSKLSGVDQADDINGFCAFFMVGLFLILCLQVAETPTSKRITTTTMCSRLLGVDQTLSSSKLPYGRMSSM